jgi:hypothetical protein
MLEKAARSYARIAGVTDDEAWLLARGVHPTEYSVEGYLEAMLGHGGPKPTTDDGVTRKRRKRAARSDRPPANR